MFTRRKTLVKKDKRIHLIGMSHIAKEGFYKKMHEEVCNLKDVVCLTEGVSDYGKISQAGIKESYEKIAKLCGLASQSKQGILPNSINSDLDISIFPEKEIKLLDFISVLLPTLKNILKDKNITTKDKLDRIKNHFQSIDLKEALKCLDDKDDSPYEKQNFEYVIKNTENKRLESKSFYEFYSKRKCSGIIRMRNQNLLNIIRQSDYKEVCVPWGAKHLAPIEMELIKDGYSLESSSIYIAYNLIGIFFSIAKNAIFRRFRKEGNAELEKQICDNDFLAKEK